MAAGGREPVTLKPLVRHLGSCATQVDLIKDVDRLNVDIINVLMLLYIAQTLVFGECF